MLERDWSEVAKRSIFGTGNVADASFAAT
ncbi:hypothetical protein [Bradyrhizobium tropiciagri]